MGKIDDLYFEKSCKYYELFKTGDYEKGWKMILDTEEIFDDSKESESCRYNYYRDILEVSIMSNRFDIGEKYIDIFLNCDLERGDKGHREFIIGKFYFEQGKKELATKFFEVAYTNKYSKCLFNKKEFKKYLEFIKKYLADKEEKKSLKDDSLIHSNEQLKIDYEKNFTKLQELCENGEKEFEKEHLQKALELYMNAWDMIPSPKGVYEATAWVATAIGEVLVEMKNCKEALHFFEEAYYAINGKLNPYINFMIGKCLYELNNVKKAIPYLRMAYELDGDNLFEDENPELLELIK